MLPGERLRPENKPHDFRTRVKGFFTLPKDPERTQIQDLIQTFLQIFQSSLKHGQWHTIPSRLISLTDQKEKGQKFQLIKKNIRGWQKNAKEIRKYFSELAFFSATEPTMAEPIMKATINTKIDSIISNLEKILEIARAYVVKEPRFSELDPEDAREKISELTKEIADCLKRLTMFLSSIGDTIKKH